MSRTETTKRIMAALLAVLTCFSIVAGAVPVKANAAALDLMGNPSTYHMESSMVASGTIYGKYRNDGINHSGINIHSLNYYPAYCIEYNKEEPYENNAEWNMGNTAGDFIGSAVQTQMVYGLAETIDGGTLGSDPTPGLTANHKKRILLQLLIYEIQIGYLVWDSSRGVIVENTSFNKQTRDVHTYWIANTYGLTSGDTAYYNYINEYTPTAVRERLSSHEVSLGNIALTYDEGTQLYTGSATDSTGYLVYFDSDLAAKSLNDSQGAFVTFTRSGSTLNVTASKAGYEKYFSRSGGKGNLTVSGIASQTKTQNTDSSAPGHAPVTSFTRYGGSDTAIQQLLTVQPTTEKEAVVSMNQFTLSAEDAEPRGSVTVTKTSEDGIIYGLKFKLTSTDSGNIYSATKSTDINGKAVFTEVPYGNYTLTEETNPKYKDLSATVTVSAQNANVSFSANNKVIWGDVEITKTDKRQGSEKSGDASFAGIKYAITAVTTGRTKTGTSFTPGQVITEITTDASGTAKTTGGLLPYGTYKVTESDTGSSGYALDSGWYYTFSVSSSDDGDKDGISVYKGTQADETLIGGIEITKKDAASGLAEASGDSTLAGAVFDILNRSASSVTVNGTKYAPGAKVMSVTTDESGKVSTGLVLPYGTYEVKETSAPAGYLVNTKSQTVKVHAAGTEAVSVTEQTVLGGINIEKKDALTGTSDTTGDCTLSGAVFDILNRSAAAVTVNGTRYAPGEKVMSVTTDKSGKASTGHVLPYGTYEVKETTAPAGYVVNAESQTVQIRAAETKTVTVKEDPVLGGIDIEKKDAQTGTSATTGDCTLAGAVFNILNRSASSVTVDGMVYAPGDTVMSVTTDDAGKATTGLVLPYGTYEVNETTAPAGYLVDMKSKNVKIRAAEAETVTVMEEPVRYNLVFRKIDGETLEPLAGVVFRISLLNTDGTVRESHLAVTDKDGWFDSGNLLSIGTLASANANDAMEGTNGLDESAFVKYAPVWFSGTGDPALPTDRTTGAFPYGTYRIEELRCAGNSEGTSSTGKNYILIESFTVEMHRPAGERMDDGRYEPWNYEFVLDNRTPPVINTYLSQKETGFREIIPAKGLSLLDRVELSNLETEREYILSGTLMDRATGLPALDDDGNEITARTEFTADGEIMAVDIIYDFDGENAGEAAYVSFLQMEKKLSDGSTVMVQVDEDLSDVDETVVFMTPAISTMASSADGNKVVPSVTESVIKDVVSYENLAPGEEYTLTGRLWDKTGECFVTDSNGEEVTAEKAFVPETSDGEVTMEFEFDGTGYQGHEIVVFEKLFRSEVPMAEHEDADDEAQTVTMERYYLTKIDASTGEPLEGAKIRVMDRTADTIDETVSDADGRVYFILLPGHRYSYQELEAPEGYVLDSDIYSFEVDAEGKPDCELIIKNRKTGSVVISKTDALSGRPLENAEISVYAGTDTECKEPLFTQKTDRLGQICFDPAEYLEGADGPVTFLFKETAAPEGYYLETDVFSFTIAKDGKVTGTTAIADVPVGTVAIKKTDENGAVLSGAKLSVYTEKGKLVGQATTGSTGRIYFTPDEPGKYYFTEDEAPKGYIRDTGKHYFTIDENGEITNEYGKHEAVVLKNAKQPSGATGDTKHAGLAVFVSVGCFAAAGAGWYFFFGKNRKKKGKHAV